MFSVMMAGAAGMFGGCSGMLMGCTPADQSALLDTNPTGLTADVAAKAEQVAREIGGVSGFGGSMMNGYFDHMDDHMGFHDAGDLASGDGTIAVTFTNDSLQECTFHFAFMRSVDGLDGQTRDVDVSPGQSVTIDMPCGEIVGMGSFTNVGATAGSAADGTDFDNRFCVPGFLHSDFACGGEFACTLGPDVNDVDQDGDIQELIMLTSGMQRHMASADMGRHGSDSGDSLGGMMGQLGMMDRGR